MLALLNGNPVVEPEGMRNLAYEEDYAAGNRFIGKHGLTEAVVSELALLPEAGFGLFVSYNSASASDAPTELLRGIAERYFKQASAPRRPIPTAQADARTVAGSYQRSERADSNFLRLLAFFQQLVVEPLPDGKIRFGAGSPPLIETAPLVFEGPNDLRVSFRNSGQSGMVLNLSAMPLAMEWERVPFYLDRRLVLPAVGAPLAMIRITMLLWPAAILLRRRRGMAFSQVVRDCRDYRWTRVVLAFDLAALAGTLAFAGLVTADLTRMNWRLDPLLMLIYAFAWLGVAGAPIVAWIAWRFWRDRVGSMWARVHHTLLAATVVVLAWFYITWRLSGVTLNY